MAASSKPDEKIDEKKRQFHISTPLTGYPRTMRFNRFCYENGKTHLVAHFGFISGQGVVIDLYSFTISKEDLNTNRTSSLQYLDRLAEVPDVKVEPWSAPSDRRNVDVIRIIGVANHGGTGELSLSTFSVASLFGRSTKERADFTAQPVALLTCDTALQKYVVEKLYTTFND